jgi:hypothetical protein
MKPFQIIVNMVAICSQKEFLKCRVIIRNCVPFGTVSAPLSEHAASNFIFGPHFLGIERSPNCVFIQLTLNSGRTLDQKRAFYKRVADELHARLDMRREDVLINLVPVAPEDWSFGNGEAPLVRAP